MVQIIPVRPVVCSASSGVSGKAGSSVLQVTTNATPKPYALAKPATNWHISASDRESIIAATASREFFQYKYYFIAKC